MFHGPHHIHPSPFYTVYHEHAPEKKMLHIHAIKTPLQDQAILTCHNHSGRALCTSIHEANLCTQKQQHSLDPIFRSRPADITAKKLEKPSNITGEASQS
ncbi:hypothetical protein Dimus_017834 [Dionaea muscipula]